MVVIKISFSSFQKYQYYEEKANNELQKQMNTLKDYNRTWWRFYYYDSLSNGYDHKEAYKQATQSLKEQKKLDEKLLQKLLKKNKNIKNISKDDLYLLSLELAIKNKRS